MMPTPLKYQSRLYAAAAMLRAAQDGATSYADALIHLFIASMTDSYQRAFWFVHAQGEVTISQLADHAVTSTPAASLMLLDMYHCHVLTRRTVKTDTGWRFGFKGYAYRVDDAFAAVRPDFLQHIRRSNKRK
jgi:hypothetical protein